jgi:hypothetical protein
MYSVCEKQIDWSDGLFLTLRWEDYWVCMSITSHNSWCYSGNIPSAISINPPFPSWVPPSNLASQLPTTSSLDSAKRKPDKSITNTTVTVAQYPKGKKQNCISWSLILKQEFFWLAKWPKDILEYTLLQAVQQYLKGTL